MPSCQRKFTSARPYLRPYLAVSGLDTYGRGVQDESLDEGFAESTVKHWIRKLKKQGKEALLKVVDSAPVDPVKHCLDYQAEAAIVNSSKKTHSLPKTLAIAVTVRVDWDNIYFFYRAKRAGTRVTSLPSLMELFALSFKCQVTG